MIHTAAPDEAKKDLCITTLCKYIGNVQKDPGEIKYRKIRLGNEMFQARVMSVPGSLELLNALGFTEQVVDDQSYLVLSEDAAVLLAACADDILAELVGGAALEPKLDHGALLLPPAIAATPVSLPDSFYVLGKADLERQVVRLGQSKEDQLTLRTQEMRDTKKNATRKTYRYVLLRIRFPSGQTIQATFQLKDTLESVRNVVAECLVDPKTSFVLSRIGGGGALDDLSQTLLDAELAPSAIIALTSSDNVALRADLPLASAR